MLVRWLANIFLILLGLLALISYWIATPAPAKLELRDPLVAQSKALPNLKKMAYAADYYSLTRGFKSQKYRSFCGPASIATILRAYGAPGIDQSDLFSSLAYKANVFFTGVTLAELADLAEANGLQTQIFYSDTLTLNEFRQRLLQNLASAGDYVLINYDRRILHQSGTGHISPVAAYDATTDAFLVLDQAAYKYPFTWVPATLLYQAANTRDNTHSRGILMINKFRAGRDADGVGQNQSFRPTAPFSLFTDMV